jgi:hypothetical protein
MSDDGSANGPKLATLEISLCCAYIYESEYNADVT